MRTTACLALVLALNLAGVCSAKTLYRVRVGEHRYFSRIVLDFDQPVTRYGVYQGASGRTLWVIIPAALKPGLTMPAGLPRGLTGMSLSTAGKTESRLLIGVAGGSKVRSFLIFRDPYGTHRLVVDVLSPTPSGRLAEIERMTFLPGRPWRPVESFSLASELEPIEDLQPFPPIRSSGANGMLGASLSEPRAIAPRLMIPPAPPVELPKPLARSLLRSGKPPSPVLAQTAKKRPESPPKGNTSYFKRMGRFIRGAGLKETLPNVHGPIPLRFNNPLHVFLYQFIPAPAKLIEKGEHAFRLDFSESHELGQFNAVDEVGGTSPIDPSVPLEIFVHMEVSAFRFHYDYGILDWLQAGVELPILYHHGNEFANELKEAYEKYVSGKRRLLKLIFAKRPDLRSTRFFLVDGGKTLFDSDSDTLGLGEMAFRAKFRVLPESTWIPETSFRAGLKLPTATDDQFGSGGVDGSLGLLFQKALWDTFVAYFNYSVTLPSDPFGSDNLNPQDFFTYWTFALEWGFLKRWALVAQFSASDSPFKAPPGTKENTAFAELIAARSFLVGGGLRVAFNERLMVMVGFQTDVVGRVGATADETTLFISIGFRIPPRRSRI